MLNDKFEKIFLLIKGIDFNHHTITHVNSMKDSEYPHSTGSRFERESKRICKENDCTLLEFDQAYLKRFPDEVFNASFCEI